MKGLARRQAPKRQARKTSYQSVASFRRDQAFVVPLVGGLQYLTVSRSTLRLDAQAET
jgi:hypothetical protein